MAEATTVTVGLRVLAWIGGRVPALLRWLRRPRLEIYFDPSQTYHLRAISELNGTPGRFCHFMVKNTGGATAQLCRARLMSVSVHTTSGLQGHPGFVAPRSLKWAHETNFDPKEIEVGPVGRRADLCFTVQGDNRLFFLAGPAGVGVQTVFPANPYNGKYRVRVLVDDTAGTVIPDMAELDIHFDGRWDTVSAVLVRKAP